jgi:NAD(P)H-dependent flavin oxidoreductase YrpB (nitropropane dioxygenase family)
VGDLPRDPRDLIPAETRAGVRKIAEDLGVEWHEMPTIQSPGDVKRGVGIAASAMEVVIEEKIPVFASGLGNPARWVDRLHANGTKVLSLVGNVKNAKRVADAGADVVVAQGTEAGGHTGRIATLALIPQVVDAVTPTPVVAAGGIGDGRGLAAVLALGALGAWCGTVFLVSQEANQPEVQKERILAATDEDTRVTRLYSGKTMRNITNPLIEAWDASGLQALPMGLQMLVMQDLAYSIRKAGRLELMMNAAGQVSGMMTAVRPAADILHDMVQGAADILARRLPATVTAAPGE